MSTAEMVRRCIRKDQIAWNVFVKRYQDHVRKAVYYKLYKTSSRAPRSDVDDMVQEVFLVLWQGNKLAQLRDISCLAGWLAIVTINLVASYRRGIYRKDMVTTSLNEQISEDINATLEDVIPCTHLNPAQLVETNEKVLQLEDIINSLRMSERKALRLKVHDRKSQNEIAKIMNLPIGTVASLICRAKMKVRDEMIGKLYLKA